MKNKVGIFKSVPDFRFEGKGNIVVVTGLSGSGKSYFSTNLAKETNASIFQPEWLIHYTHTADEHKPFLDAFIKKHGIEEFVKNKWNNAKCEDKNQELKKYINLLVSEFLKNADPNKKYIIEGLQIFTIIDFELIKNYTIIVKGTSSFKCLSYRLKRDYQKRKKLNFFKKTKWFFKCLHQSRLYQFKHRKLLNNFINRIKNT